MRIGIVTGTRAEFGLLLGLIQEIQSSPNLDLELFVTGSHLLPEFGMTVDLIKKAGIKEYQLVRTLRDARSGEEVGRQVGNGTADFTRLFKSSRPSAILLLGDRYETFAAAVAAYFSEIPIVHLHGGEVTRGAFDDALRHAITKLSSVHCVAHADYAKRVIQLGEQPNSVHVVGSLAVDRLANVVLKTREDLRADLGIPLLNQIFLVTYHPVTNGQRDALRETKVLVKVLEEFRDASVVLTMPNADPGHQLIAKVLEAAAERNRGRWVFVKSLGQVNYWSLMSISTAVVGNSSSGILEAPFFSVPTVNIGPRQIGRVMAPSVINCDPSTVSLSKALKLAASKKFRNSIPNDNNPYSTAGAVRSILSILESMEGKGADRKVFFDL